MPYRLASLAALAALTLLGCPTQDPALADLTVEHNPDNELSAWVRWTSEDPCSGSVEYGPDGPTYVVREDGPTADHALLAWGMRRETAYELIAVCTDADGTEHRADPRSFQSGAGPLADLVLERTVHDPDRAQPGWTLSNISLGVDLSPATAILYDADGEPIWYHRLSDEPARADIDVRLCGDDHVCIGGGIGSFDSPVEITLQGEVVWSGPPQPDVTQLMTPGEQHHTFQRLHNDNYLLMRFQLEDDGLAYDIAEEIAPDGTVLWSWHGEGPLAGEAFDYPWGNHVGVDLQDDLLLYNARNHNRLYAIDRGSAEIVWALGFDGDFEIVGGDPADWFIQAHAPEVLPDGNVLFYDNGNETRGYSRVVEYAVDHDAATAELVWQYPHDLADDPWFEFSLGDADRLDNGNTLITAASLLIEDSQSRLFEVTPEGDKVFELWLSTSFGEPAAAYAAERVPVLIETL